MPGAPGSECETVRIQQMIIDYNQKLITKALNNGGRIVPKEEAKFEFTQRIIAAATRYGHKRKTESTLVAKLKMQRKHLCRQLNQVQQKKQGPRAKEKLSINPHASAGNDYGPREKARLRDGDIERIRDEYAPMPHIDGHSFHTDDLTGRVPQIEKILAHDTYKAQELRRTVAMLKKEIVRLGQEMDTATCEVDQDPVKLTAVPYRMKPRLKYVKGL